MFFIFLFPFKLAFFLLFLFLLVVSVFFCSSCVSSLCQLVFLPTHTRTVYSNQFSSPTVFSPCFHLFPTSQSPALRLLLSSRFTLDPSSPCVRSVLHFYVGFRKFFLSLIFASHQNDFVSFFLSPASTIRVFSYLSSFPAFI